MPAAAAGWAAYVLPGPSRFRIGANGFVGGIATVRVPGDGAATLAGGWRGRVVVAAFGNRRASRDRRRAGLRTVRLRSADSQPDPVWHDDETLWRTVLAQYPDSIVANNAMVMILFLHHKMPEALACAQRYAGLMPQLGEAHNNIGFILAATDRVPEAMKEFEQALRLKPHYAEAHNNFANALMQVGRVEDARQHYEQAVQIKPRYVDAHLGLGWALFRLGRRAEAIRHYEQALQFDPESVIASNMLARLQGNQ